MKGSLVILLVAALAAVAGADAQPFVTYPALVAISPQGGGIDVVRADCAGYQIEARAAALSASRRVLVTLCGDATNHEIDLARAPFRVFRPLIVDPAHPFDLAINPSATRFAVEVAQGGQPTVEVVDRAGRVLRTLAGFHAANFAADGRRLVALDDANRVVVIGSGGNRPVLGFGFGEPPVWQPFGSWVAWQGRSGLIVLSRANGSGYRLTKPRAPGSGLSWSPDGRRLAYGSVKKGPIKGGLRILNIKSMRETVIGVFVSSTPVWSPNGQQIAFVGRSPDSNREGLMVASRDAVGWDVRQIAGFDSNSSSLNWTADGRLLIVSCLPPGGDCIESSRPL